jgi:putative peptide zinc metalloprotease protein
MNERLPAEYPQALPVCMRADLVIAPRPTRRGLWWTVKDPLALQYYQLRDEEYFVLRRLDGKTSAESVLRDFGRRFAPCRLSLDELLAFIRRLCAQGLVTANMPRPMLEIGAVRQRYAARMRWGHLSNPLVVRFRGFDPQPLLNRLYPSVRWIFSPPAMVLSAAVVVAALLLIGSQWEQFQRRIPAMSSILAPGHLVWIGAAVALVKVLHELGHAFTCRHMHGECHELGLMFLAGIPCLYCNVSDVWLLPNKWHRIAVSAAGICVELVLASICTFLWWYSEPGPFHSLCFAVMIVTSTGTLLLNGNPLMRYDGYYILSDLLDVPNLRRRSTAAFRRFCARWLFGVVEPDDDSFQDGAQGPLALFGAASAVYLWVVVVVVLRFVDRALEPLGLRPLAVLLALVVLGNKLSAAAVASAQRVQMWNSLRILRPARFGLGCLVLFGVVLCAVLIPLPHRVSAPCIVATQNAHSIYVTVPGQLVADSGAPVARYGDHVLSGEVVATLQNHELELDIARLQGECRRQGIVVEGLRRQPSSDAIAARMSSASAVLRDLEQQLERRLRDRHALLLTCPSSGVLLPPPDVGGEHADRLKREWPPLDRRNRQVYLEAGTLVAIVGTPDQYDARLVVDQTDIAYVRPGQTVRLRFPQMGASIAAGTVVEIAARPLEASPYPLVRTERLPSRLENDGTIRPVRTSYEVRVALVGAHKALVDGTVGDARIDVGRMTLARRFQRLMESTFSRG